MRMDWIVHPKKRNWEVIQDNKKQTKIVIQWYQYQ